MTFTKHFEKLKAIFPTDESCLHTDIFMYATDFWIRSRFGLDNVRQTNELNRNSLAFR